MATGAEQFEVAELVAAAVAERDPMVDFEVAVRAAADADAVSEWAPALRAAGIRHRRIYDLRHTYATWSLAAGVDLFTLSRRMGTSLAMIDATYGHLAPDADDRERALLDAFDGGTPPPANCRAPRLRRMEAEP